jgi:hypothetical protein
MNVFTKLLHKLRRREGGNEVSDQLRPPSLPRSKSTGALSQLRFRRNPSTVKRPLTPQPKTNKPPSFQEVLADDHLMRDLVKFAEREFSAENFHLFLSIKLIKTTEDKQQSRLLTNQVYEQYIKTGAPEEVSLDDWVKRTLESKLLEVLPSSELDDDIFEDLECALMRNMQDSYNRYSESLTSIS